MPAHPRARHEGNGDLRERDAWLLIGALLAIVLAWLAATGMRLSPLSIVAPGGGVAVSLTVARFYRSRRPDPRIAAAMTALAQIIAFTAVGAVFSYLVATRGGALWDADFVQMDQAFGFDWRAYYDLIETRPAMRLAFALAYSSLKLQMVLAVALLGLTGRLPQLRAFVLAVIISGIVVIAISGLMPAYTMYEFLPAGTLDRAQAVGEGYVETLRGLRAGTLAVIDLTQAEGIVAFPSYHAALGLIFARAFWHVPWARWPGLVLNGILIAATPIDGGHFFVDVLAGLAIGAAIVLALEARSRVQPLHAARTIPEGAIVPVST